MIMIMQSLLNEHLPDGPNRIRFCNRVPNFTVFTSLNGAENDVQYFIEFHNNILIVSNPFETMNSIESPECTKSTSVTTK